MEGRPPLALPAGKKNREGRAFADFGHHLDIASLPGNDLTGQKQADTHARLAVYFFLPVKSPENGGLIGLGNSFAVVAYIYLYIHFPLFHGHADFSPVRRVLYRVVQKIEQGFACPFAVMLQA